MPYADSFSRYQQTGDKALGRVESFPRMHAREEKEYAMSTIPSVSSTGLYGYTAPAANAVSAALAQSAATQLSVISTLTSLGGNSSSPLTYDESGLFGAIQQAPSSTTNTTPAQAARNAYLQVEYAIMQTTGSLISGSSSNSSNSDVSPLFTLPGTAGTSGLLGSSLPNGTTSTTGVATAQQAAQNAVLAAQYAITQALGSLISGSSSNSSSSGS